MKSLNKLKSLYHFFWAWFSAVIYGFPSKKIFVLGVTGTKGKSTTLELISNILEAAGYKTALLSTVRIKIDKESEKNFSSMTMPGRFFSQRFLRKAVNANCHFALLEVTSQGIVQHRHRFIDFNAALLTNLQPEHIEAHGSFEAYRAAKIKLFKETALKSKKPEKKFFINDECLSKRYFEEAVKGFGKVIYFNRENFIKNELNPGTESIGDWLSSDFNLENAAAATTFTKSLKIKWPLIKQTLMSFKGLEGRMEVVQEKPFKVVIDYAHTPDSLEKVYHALKSQKSNVKSQKLICVLGSAGGGRDHWKRPVMGKIAARYCQTIILTNEDPYDEDPMEIINQIADGAQNIDYRFQQVKRKTVSIWKILNREEAIKKAISLAKKGDIIIITGKGSELWMRLAEGKKISWNEKQIVEQALNNN
jgi:UDP-N-acetylmuramoyl-L-alanyl-D-glutamate--2,6-diaminopimelate ligase